MIGGVISSALTFLKLYDRDQSIVSNCSIRIAYAPNTLETAKYLSDTLGCTTLQKKQINYSGNRFKFLLGHMNMSEQEIKRPLLTPDELMRMPQSKMLIFKTGFSPILGEKICYYRDDNFSARVKSNV